MSSVSYGSYNFPTPLPAIAESVEPIFIAGNFDHSKVKIDVAGFITGENPEGLLKAKKAMVDGLSSSFHSFVVLGQAYTFSKPTAINFEETKMSTLLPYSVSFESLEEGSFSAYFGVRGPVNNWTYSEEDGRIISATHTISAIGTKVQNGDSLENAKTFVNNLTGFQNLSSFHDGNTAFIMSTVENIDPAKKKYSVTETYKFDSSDHPVSNVGIGNLSASINYAKSSELKVDVNGSIIGALGGSTVSIASFTEDQATEYAKQSVISTLSDFEADVYSFISDGPTTYKYTVNAGENKIDFSFSFLNSDCVQKIGNVCHETSASISATKDNGTITVSVQGKLFFNSSVKVVGDVPPETSERFVEVKNAFATVNQFNLATQAFKSFISAKGSEYKVLSPRLSQSPVSFSENKSPFPCEISYNYQYNNIIDPSNGALTNCLVTISDSVPIVQETIKPSVLGFASQIVCERTLGKFSVSASSQDSGDKLDKLKGVVDGYMKGTVNSDTEADGGSSISCAKSALY